jgi:hypothetical protein
VRIKVNSLNQDQIKASIDKYCMQLLPEFENVANNSDEVKFYDDDDSQEQKRDVNIFILIKLSDLFKF